VLKYAGPHLQGTLRAGRSLSHGRERHRAPYAGGAGRAGPRQDTLGTVAHWPIEVIPRSCFPDEGSLTAAVTLRGHSARAEIILSAVVGPDAVDEVCPGSMVVNRIAIR
jgi:hypothetical protein